MDAPTAIAPEALDQDLQLVRTTLAAVLDDVNRLSSQAGWAIRDALEKIDAAHAEFLNSLEET
jgi:hypothetical protein